MRITSRGVGHTALFTVCVLVLLGFIIGASWAMGEVLVGLVRGAVDTHANAVVR